MSEKKVSLYNTEGGADKVYTLWLEPATSGWTVEAQWGRRGGPMQAGAKTPKTVSREDAEKVYEKTLKEKRAKGYHEGEDAPAFSQIKDAVDTGLRPMLLTDASAEDPELYLTDPSWGAQEKMNGKRIMIRTTTGGVVGSNRRGLECPIPEILLKELASWDGDLDGELIGDIYYAFDLLEIDGRDLRGESYLERHTELVAFRPTLNHVKVVPLVVGEKAKRALYEKLKADRKEGIVWKRLKGHGYIPGKIENIQKAIAVKMKFYSEAVVTILRLNKAKQSIGVGMLKDLQVVSVGNVTVPTKYLSQIVVGGLIRVRYLYATEASQLYQPTLDPTSDGSVIADQVKADSVTALKFEGKEEG